MRLIHLGLIGAVALLVTGCEQVDYYQHLARGQLRVILDRRPVAELLEDPATDEHVRQRLLLIGQVRAFAEAHIGLSGTSDNYTQFYDTGGEPVAWNVSACPPDRFDAYLWTFPFVGALPYKGYFDRSRAEAERDRLIGLGFDAIVSGVSAYSTLGYLSDPVLSTMLDDTEDRLVDLVLHELTHATIYVEDHTDYNESIASFVGQQGALLFLQNRYGRHSPQVEQLQSQRQAVRAFQGFVRSVTARLDSLYSSGSPTPEVLQARVQIFNDSKLSYRQQRDELGAGRFDGYLSWEINNARLLAYRRYNSNFDSMQALLLRHGGDLAAALESLKYCGATDAPWVCLDDMPANNHTPATETARY